MDQVPFFRIDTLGRAADTYGPAAWAFAIYEKDTMGPLAMRAAANPHIRDAATVHLEALVRALETMARYDLPEGGFEVDIQVSLPEVHAGFADMAEAAAANWVDTENRDIPHKSLWVRVFYAADRLRQSGGTVDTSMIAHPDLCQGLRMLSSVATGESLQHALNARIDDEINAKMYADEV